MVNIGKVDPPEWVRAQVTYFDPVSGTDHTQATDGTPDVVAAWLRAVAERLAPARPTLRGVRDAGGPVRLADTDTQCGECGHPQWEHSDGVCRRATLGIACRCVRTTGRSHGRGDTIAVT